MSEAARSEQPKAKQPGPRALRVLVSGVVFGQPQGGVRRHNAELLPRAAALLARTGGELVVLEGSEASAFPLGSEELPIRTIASDVPPRPPLRRARREGRVLREVLDRARHEELPFDLVHTAHLPAPSGFDVPFTLTLHDLRDLRRARSGAGSLVRRLAFKPLLADAVRRSAAVITVSENVRNELRRRFPEAHFELVSNGADHLPVLPRKKLPAAPLLYVGHLEPRKNVQLLLAALAHDPALPELLVVGAAKGNEAERLRAMANELGVADRVQWLGAISDEELVRVYARAGALALPSHVEGFGIPVVEAQRAGLPVAVARGSALVEVAGPDVPSFAPDDAHECARSLRKALATPPAETEAIRARLPWTWDDAAQELVACWRRAVDK